MFIFLKAAILQPGFRQSRHFTLSVPSGRGKDPGNNMYKGKQVSIIFIVGLSLIVSACSSGQTSTPTATETLIPTSTSTSAPTASLVPSLTPTPTDTPTSTDTPTMTPTYTLTFTPTLLATVPTVTQLALPTLPPINLPSNPTAAACVPTGQPSCQTFSSPIPGAGSCTLTVCTDSCGNITSQSTLNCS